MPRLFSFGIFLDCKVGEKMKVAVVKAENYQSRTVNEAVNKAVDLLGGWEKHIKKGDKVLIKPNMLTAAAPEKAVTTHPEVVRAVIKAVKSQGAYPSVADSPGVSNVKKNGGENRNMAGLRSGKRAVYNLGKKQNVSLPGRKIRQAF